MSELLPFIITGIATGAIGAGLLGTGLVLTYRTSGILNLAHGAIATIAALVFYWLHVEHGIHWAPAAFVAVIGTGTISGLVMSSIAARLLRRTQAYRILATIGIVLVVQGFAVLWYGAATIRVEQFLPKGRDGFELLGAVVTWEKVILTVVGVAATAALFVVLRWTRTGLAMRAVVDDSELVAMQAVDPARVRRIAWILASVFAALSGVLILPLVGLDSIGLTFLVVQAFGAAAIGRFSSIPLTFLGGVLLGVAASLATKYVVDVSWLAGLPSSLPFIVLLVVLIVTPKGALAAPPVAERTTPSQYRSPARVRLFAGFLVVLPLAFVPELVGAKLTYFTVGLVTGIMLLSLGLIVRTSGQVSLCHAAFAAIGAVAFSQLHVEHGMPWVLALVVAGAITVPVGAVVAVPAIRLSGIFLALATFGFGILVQRLLYGQGWMFTELSQGRRMPRPSFAESPEAYYRVVLVAAIVIAVLVVVVQRSRLGRVLQGMSGAPTAMAASGLSTEVSKVLVFCISAFIAGVGGALLGVERGFASSGDPFFGSFFSLILLAMLALAPFAEPWFALMPAAASVLPAFWHSGNASTWLNITFGVSAVVVAVRGGYPVTPMRIQALLNGLGPRKLPIPKEPQTLSRSRRPSGEGLVVDSLKVSFGGLVAVDDISFKAPLGQITGLIGPNGAGKTTTFDACSGLNRRCSGNVQLHGRDITPLTPAARARRGLGRTFQRMDLADRLTVLENVALGAEARLAGASPMSQLAATSRQLQTVRSAAWAAVQECGLTEVVHQQVGTLSTGHRRLVELARVLAGGFDVLLLDEPSSGLDHAETAAFGSLLVRIVRSRGVAVLIVEHDVELVTSVCDYVYLLDFGRIIFEGTAERLLDSPVVQEAYLGMVEGSLLSTEGRATLT